MMDKKASMILILSAGLAALGFFQPDHRTDNFVPDIGTTGFLDEIEQLKQLGYGFVQPSVGEYLAPDETEAGFEEIAGRYREHAEFIYACNIFLPGSLKSTGPDYDPEGILSYSETVFKRAEKAGVEVIVFGSSGSRSFPEGFTEDEAREQFIELGRQMGPLAEKYGVIVAVENLNREESNFINTVQEAYEIVREIGHPNVRITADIYHMLREEEGPDAIRQAGEYIYHVDIAEKEDRTPPGVTEDDFRPYLRALRDIGFEGKIAIEARWEDPDRELPLAIKYLQTQLESLE